MQDVGQLGLAVGVAGVVALLPVDVIPVNAHSPRVREARHVDDPEWKDSSLMIPKLFDFLIKILPCVEILGLGRFLDEWQEELCEKEMTQVVGAKLHVEAVLCLPLGTGHDASIVDEDVDLGLLLSDSCCAFPHRLEGAQVKLIDVNLAVGLLLDLLLHWLCLFQTPTEH